jgi:hypothetical protein
VDRSNHYEAAFEAYLRDRRVGFVPVDEARRTLLGGADVKSLDFIVVGPDSARLVVDVKGRKFPGGKADHPRPVWQNWSTEEDVDGLARWAAHFGPAFRGVLAFVYHIGPPFALPAGTPDLFVHRDRTYLVRAVSADDYRRHARPRSRRWGTVHLPTADFRRLVRPFSDFLKDGFTTETQRAQREEEERPV